MEASLKLNESTMTQTCSDHRLSIARISHGFQTSPGFFWVFFCKILLEYPDFLQNFLRIRNKIKVFLNLPGFSEKDHGQPMWSSTSRLFRIWDDFEWRNLLKHTKVGAEIFQPRFWVCVRKIYMKFIALTKT